MIRLDLEGEIVEVSEARADEILMVVGVAFVEWCRGNDLDDTLKGAVAMASYLIVAGAKVPEELGFEDYEMLQVLTDIMEGKPSLMPELKGHSKEVQDAIVERHVNDDEGGCVH